MLKTKQIIGKFNAVDKRGSVTVSVQKHGQSGREILFIRNADTEGEIVAVVHRSRLV